MGILTPFLDISVDAHFDRGRSDILRRCGENKYSEAVYAFLELCRVAHQTKTPSTWRIEKKPEFVSLYEHDTFEEKYASLIRQTFVESSQNDHGWISVPHAEIFLQSFSKYSGEQYNLPPFLVPTEGLSYLHALFRQVPRDDAATFFHDQHNLISRLASRSAQGIRARTLKEFLTSFDGPLLR